MGWFTNLSANQKINRKISDMEERLEIVEKHLKTAILDWDELYDKTRRALGRMVKRAKVDAPINSPEEEGVEETPAPPSDGLSPAQRRINEQILALRGRG